MSAREFEDIKLVDVMAAQVTRPRNDGTEGSALYSVPIRLSAAAPSAWALYFVEAWDHPSRFSTMHRPGIARVSGQIVTLAGTTLEEVEKYHRDTLTLAAGEANRQYRDMLDRDAAREAREQELADQHRAHVDEVAKRISFDE